MHSLNYTFNVGLPKKQLAQLNKLKLAKSEKFKLSKAWGLATDFCGSVPERDVMPYVALECKNMCIHRCNCKIYHTSFLSSTKVSCEVAATLKFFEVLTISKEWLCELEHCLVEAL